MSERDSLILHKVQGNKCYHASNTPTEELVVGGRFKQCHACGRLENNWESPDYTSDWSAYGPFLEWAKGEKWWDRLIRYLTCDDNDCDAEDHDLEYRQSIDILLTPSSGAYAIADYLIECVVVVKEEDI